MASAPAVRRPDAAALAAARDRTLPDVLAPGAAVVFCGINPGLWSAATGHHFARPGNRFWPALHDAGFTPRLLRPDEQDELPRYGLGVTNLAPRATARAAELGDDELRRGGAELARKLAALDARWLAVAGVTAYRVAYAEPKATVGEQPRTFGATRVWVLPNPSGLNAHYTRAGLATEFTRLREAADLPAR